MTELVHRGFKIEADAPDGTVCVRKHATREYKFARLRKKDGVWVLLGCSHTFQGAQNLVTYRLLPTEEDIIVPCRAIPRMVKPRNPGGNAR